MTTHSNQDPPQSVGAAQYRRERRALQLAVAMVATFPLLLGTAVVLTGLRGFFFLFGLDGPVPDSPTLDSAVRFLAANFLGMGLIALWVLPRIEQRTTAFRIFVAAAVVGACARLLSHITVGSPNLMTQLLIGVELGVLFLGLWQARVARLYQGLSSSRD